MILPENNNNEKSFINVINFSLEHEEILERTMFRKMDRKTVFNFKKISI